MSKKTLIGIGIAVTVGFVAYYYLVVLKKTAKTGTGTNAGTGTGASTPTANEIAKEKFIIDYMANIKGDWLVSLQEKATREGKDIDEVLREIAIWMMNNDTWVKKLMADAGITM